jgi:hypothetical protein
LTGRCTKPRKKPLRISIKNLPRRLTNQFTWLAVSRWTLSGQKNQLHIFDVYSIREQFGEAAGEVGYDWTISKKDADEINQMAIELLYKKNSPGIFGVEDVELIREALK